MTALFRLDLPLDTSCDALFFLSVLTGPAAVAMLDLAAGTATAALSVRGTPSDPAPLLTVSTTSSSSGQITAGVALPSPQGASAANDAQLQAILAQGTPLLVDTPPQPITYTFATVAALRAQSTTGVTLGTLAEVTGSPGGFYAFALGSALADNGTTIIRATDAGGSWLLASTLVIRIAQAAMAPLVGTSWAQYDLLVTWPDGTTTKLLEGSVPVGQSD